MESAPTRSIAVCSEEQKSQARRDAAGRRGGDASEAWLSHLAHGVWAAGGRGGSLAAAADLARTRRAAGRPLSMSQAQCRSQLCSKVVEAGARERSSWSRHAATRV